MLVADARFPAALAGIRALGAAGIDVVALDSSRLAGGCWSRAARGRARVPDAEVDPQGFAERTVELADGYGHPPVFAAAESTIDALLDAGLGRAFAPASVLGALREKVGLEAVVRGTGLLAPPILARCTAARLPELEIDRDVVIKGVDPSGPLRGMRLAGDRLALFGVSADLPDALEVIVQERVVGPQFSIAVVLAKDGELLARFGHAVERTWPIDGGATSLARSEEPDPVVVDAVTRMLRQAGFWGLAQLDLVAGLDGPVVLDVNTRFYGSMALAGACGINLPAAWHSAATDRPRPEPASYRHGLSFWWAEADIRALHRVRRPRVEHVGPLWAPGDRAAGALIQAAAGLREARARFPRPDPTGRRS